MHGFICVKDHCVSWQIEAPLGSGSDPLRPYGQPVPEVREVVLRVISRFLDEGVASFEIRDDRTKKI